jgi:hypothetical protein
MVGASRQASINLRKELMRGGPGTHEVDRPRNLIPTTHVLQPIRQPGLYALVRNVHSKTA